MTYRTQMDESGKIIGYKDSDTGQVIPAKEYERRMQMQATMPTSHVMHQPGMTAVPPNQVHYIQPSGNDGHVQRIRHGAVPHHGYHPAQPGLVHQVPGAHPGVAPGAHPALTHPALSHPAIQQHAPGGAAANQASQAHPLVQPGAQVIGGAGGQHPATAPHQVAMGSHPNKVPSTIDPSQGKPPTAGHQVQGKTLRLEGIPKAHPQQMSHTKMHRRSHGFLDATSVAILLPTLVLLALIIAAAHKKRLFPWQTIRTFNPPSGMLTPRDYERSYLCPPNLRRHGRMGKRNPNSTWTDEDGVVLPFGFLARTHLPVTIPMGRLPNKNMFMVAPSGSGKTTLMRAIIKSMLAKPCVIIALEAKANDPNLDEKKEGFKYTVLPEAEHAGFQTLYFNPLDQESIHWNPLDLSPIQFATSIVQDVNSLDAEEQHWAERDMGYIEGLAQLLKWGAVQVIKEDENGSASDFAPLPCNPRGLMKLVNNRRNIVESLRQLKSNADINSTELSELTQRLSSIIRTDNDWDKNIQGVRGRLRMFKNEGILRVTEQSDIDMNACMHQPTVLIFGAPASLGPDAESLAGTFVYQLQQALHTRYGTKSVLPLFAFFDEYQTLNIDLAGRLSAIVRGANGGLTVILQNISQISAGPGSSGSQAEAELRTIFSNSAIRVCLHNADEQTAAFFSEEIGKHAVIVPGIADHYQSTGFGIFPTSWNRIHSQQVVARVDPDAVKRMEKHHALVYLAPAGDPEFGETKPFMVDLRGIEEIARLHLLHNVNTPSDGDGGDGQPSFASVTHPADAINSAFSPQQAETGQEAARVEEPPTVAQQVTNAAQSVLGQLFGTRAHDDRQQQAGAAGFAAVPGTVDAMTAARNQHMDSGAVSEQTPPGSVPGFVGSAGGIGVPRGANAMAAQTDTAAGGGQQEAASAMQAMAAMSEAPTAQAQGQAQAPAQIPAESAAAQVPTPQAATPAGPRSCPHCNANAGKGKFCIECGKFIGTPGGQPAQAAAPASTPQATGAQPVASQSSLVGPMGSRPKSNAPQPRYGGLDVTARDAVPQKKPFSQGAAMGSNPYQQAQAQLARGTAGVDGAGPLSAKVSQEQAAQSQVTDENQRQPVKSLKPDVSRFGFAQVPQNSLTSQVQKGQQPGGGVEF